MRRQRHLLLMLLVGLPQTIVAQTAATRPSLIDPRPENAIGAVLAAFDTFRVVALGDAHGTKDLNDFVLTLIRHPRFARAANDIVVECLNSRLQPLLDRFVAGEDIPVGQAQALWRDQTHPPCSVDDFHHDLIVLVRRINQGLPATRRLRIVAGEPSLDWPTTTPAVHQAFLAQRDAHAAEVLDDEVLAKGHRALVLYGLGHLFHGMKPMLVGRSEMKYPGVTFVIAPYLGALDGAQCGAAAAVNGTSLDTLMAPWPVPSLARTHGTLFSVFAANQFARQATAFGASAEPVNAYLYLGPPRLLLAAPPSAQAFLDAAFVTELARRATVMAGGAFYDDRIEANRVRGASERFACRAAN
jgi:hypothetical protein